MLYEDKWHNREWDTASSTQGRFMLILNNQGRTYSAENETVVQAQLRAPTPPPQGLCPRSSAQDIVSITSVTLLYWL